MIMMIDYNVFYSLQITVGSTNVRVGTAIFGPRQV